MSNTYTLREVQTKYRKKHFEAVKYIDNIFNKTPEDYDKEFVELAKLVVTTKQSPYSFMPKGWEGCTTRATDIYDFLIVLHHAMVDDGDITFIKDVHGYPKMEFDHPSYSTLDEFKENYKVSTIYETSKELIDYLKGI